MYAARQVGRALASTSATVGIVAVLACGGSAGDSPTAPGGGGGPGSGPSVWTPAPGVHVNPADPTLLTAHDSAGNLVDVIGDRAADGTPTAIRGWRRYDPTNPKAADVVTLGANRLPASIGLRDGTTAALSYDKAGHVMLAVRTPDGQVHSTTFSWRPPPGVIATVGSQSAPAVSLRRAASAFLLPPRRAGGTTASTIPITFQVTETPGGAAVTTASVSGTWASQLTGGSFVAVATGAPGTYVAQVPSNPQLGVVTATQPFCNALSQLSSATSVSAGTGVEIGICGILDGGTSITGVGTLLQSQFLSAALLTACAALVPGSVATCTALAEALDAYCTAVATCETLSAVNDAAALDAALSINGVVQVGAIPIAASATFNPATQTSPITVQVPLVPAKVVVMLASSTVTVGQTVQATAQVYSAAGTPMPNEPVQWSITSGAATVDQKGLVTVTGASAFTVSATAGTVAGTATLSAVTEPLVGSWTLQTPGCGTNRSTDTLVSVTATFSPDSTFSVDVVMGVVFTPGRVDHLAYRGRWTRSTTGASANSVQYLLPATLQITSNFNSPSTNSGTYLVQWTHAAGPSPPLEFLTFPQEALGSGTQDCALTRVGP